MKRREKVSFSVQIDRRPYIPKSEVRGLFYYESKRPKFQQKRQRKSFETKFGFLAHALHLHSQWGWGAFLSLQGEMKVAKVGIERGNRIEGGCVCKSFGRVGRW